MNESNLRSVDLNLLVILNVLIEEKHITNAANKLNISQSAMSKALARIRTTFNDPILIRMPNGYELSDRAKELVVSIKRILGEIQEVVEPQNFNSFNTEYEFIISALDYAEMLVGEAYMQNIIQKAPQSRITVVPRTRNTFDELAAGNIDITFGATPKKYPENCIVEPSGDGKIVCVVGKSHPLAEKKTITLDDYLEYPHSILPTTLEALPIDSALNKIGQKRKIAKQSHSFVASIMSLKNTNMILSLPKATVKPLVDIAGLVMHDIPFEVPSISFSLIWHKRNTENPAHKWFREELKSVIESI